MSEYCLANYNSCTHRKTLLLCVNEFIGWLVVCADQDGSIDVVRGIKGTSGPQADRHKYQTNSNLTQLPHLVQLKIFTMSRLLLCLALFVGALCIVEATFGRGGYGGGYGGGGYGGGGYGGGGYGGYAVAYQPVAIKQVAYVAQPVVYKQYAVAVPAYVGGYGGYGGGGYGGGGYGGGYIDC